MLGAVRKWGNSAAVRIPAAAMQAAELHLDQMVEIRAEGGAIVIEPVRAATGRLAALLAGITAENTHGEIGFGRAVGNEAL
ncbi:MAG: AbrB/MazE/SpoVT family DNA-binding domain-containing protein [Acetobacteraceae bacterium]